MGCGLSRQAAQQVTCSPPEIIKHTGDPVLESSSTNVGNAYLYETRAFGNEAARLAALKACNMLDTAEESRFDVITRLAASLFQTPCALVSLIDDDHLWFKSQQGHFESCVDREGSFCSYITVPDTSEVLIVENATQDARFSANLFVCGPPGIRFYAGAPLVSSDGFRYGTLCVVDFKPRKIASTLYNVLCNLAELTVRELEKDIALQKSVGTWTPRASSEGEEGLFSPFAAVSTKPAVEEPVILVCIQNDTWQVIYANEAWISATGLSESEIINHNLYDTYEPVSFKELYTSRREPMRISPRRQLEDIKKAVVSGNEKPPSLYLRKCNKLVMEDGGDAPVIRLDFKLATRDQLANAAPVGIPSFVPLSARSSPTSIRTSEDENGPKSDGNNDAPTIFIGVGTLLPSSCPSGVDSYQSGASSVSYTARSLSIARSTSLAGHNARLRRIKPPQLANVELGPLLGHGSYGRVYRGKLGDKAVAIKVLELPRNRSKDDGDMGGNSSSSATDLFDNLLPEMSVSPLDEDSLVDNEVVESKIMQEASLSRFLAHPNIVPTFDYVLRPGDECNADEIWIIQHLCNRGTLYNAIDKGWLRQEPSLDALPSVPKILKTAHEIASGMWYLHQRDILHGDLNGNNVLLSETFPSPTCKRGWRAMISDFGLSRFLTAGNQDMMTKTVGTISHMPPELLIDGILGKSTDVYAFGVLLWELFSGRRAWAGANPAQVIFAVTVQGKQLRLPEDAPEELKELTKRCMHAEAGARPGFEEVVEELTRLCQQCGVAVDNT